MDNGANSIFDKRKREQSKEIRTKRIKFVIHVAAGIGEREGSGESSNHAKITQRES